MDFFEHQDQARRNTRRLVVLFVLAVIAIVVAVYLAVLLILFGSELRTVAGDFDPWAPRLFLPVAAATLLVIAAGSGYKTLQLADGGAAVGRLLGGRPLDPNTTDLEERRILNVVEEMAIASGTPVPDVYLLDEERSINAFAAGRTRDDAVIGITRGSGRLLSRDELQGVVAHEFSHVLNGDMRLNLRLMGVLHGILVISMIGYLVMRTGGGSSSRRRGKGGGGAVVLLGLALYLIGWIGVFFGRLIKAAVSRQREYLADAAAVQFTRNPSGLGDALKKIGGYGAGSRIQNRRAEEASHLFFADGLKKHFLGMTATHPPLDERIRRIDPSFDGSFPAVAWPEEAAAETREAAAPRARPDVVGGAILAGAGIGAGTAAAAGVVESVGTLDTAHLAFAAALLAELPDGLRAAAREPASARALVFAVLLDAERAVRVRQLEELRRTMEPALVEQAQRLGAKLAVLPPGVRIPLLDLALPALRRMSPEQYESFRSGVDALARADGRISLFEYALHRMLLRHLDPRFREAPRPAVQYYALDRLGAELSCLLSLLARAGHPGAEEEAARAFAAAAGALGAEGGGELALRSREECDLTAFDRALERLATAAPRLRKRVLAAAVAAVAHDREVSAEEGELLRAVADGLDCPVPPFLRATEG